MNYGGGGGGGGRGLGLGGGSHRSWFAYVRSGDEHPQMTGQLLRRVFAYARPYWRETIGMLVAILLSTGLTLLTPLIFRNMIDQVIPAGDVHRLILLALALLIIPVLNGVIGVAQRQWNAIVGEGVIFDLRVALYSRLQRMSLRFFTNTKIGELMSRLNNDVVGAQSAVSNTIVTIITNIIEAVAILIVMFSLDWRLTLISVAILPLFIVAARRLGDRLREITRQQLEMNAEMNAHMNETLNIGGALLIKLFGRAKEEDKRFSERAWAVREMDVQSSVIGVLFFAIIGLVTAVGTALVYGFGGYFVIEKTFTIGTMVAFGSYLANLYNTLQSLSNAPVTFSTSVVSFERVFEVLDLPQEIAEKKDAMVMKDVQGDLIFETVNFNYDEAGEKGLLGAVKRYGSMDNVNAVLSLAGSGDGKNGHDNGDTDDSDVHSSQARDVALEDISFRAKPGQLVALVGPSGAGKTTLTYLIPRLYDPTSGVIRIDGHDLKDVTLDSLSSAIGMVTQETYLFHDTIRTNLTYAKMDATQSEIEAAAKAANIHQFITDLPDRYNTIVGERGYRLSGGEKQRIALARVILKDPRILVLDEATSSLDSESESLIQDALKRVMAGRTSIVIAHRLSTILAADLILVMDRGQIVERGTHEELLATGGLYSQLYETQFRGERV